MREVLYRFGVLVASLFAAVGSSFIVFALGLFVPFPVVVPITVAFTALCTALAAAWTANLLSPDGSSSRILTVIGVAGASAVVISLALFGLTLLLSVQWPFPALPLLVLIVFTALAASFSSWRARTPSRQLRRDALASLGYLAAGMAMVAITIIVACAIVPCIP